MSEYYLQAAHRSHEDRQHEHVEAKLERKANVPPVYKAEFANPLAEFLARCERADWTHHESDDIEVYRRGRAQVDGLRAEADADPGKRLIFDAWDAFAHWYCLGDRTEKPRPVLADLLARASGGAV